MSHLLLILAILLLAFTIQIQTVVGNLEFEDVAHHVLDLLEAGIAKFEHFSAIDTYEVVVLFEAVGFLVLRQVFAKLVLFHEVAIDQQLQGIVHRSPAHPVILGFHVDI